MEDLSLIEAMGVLAAFGNPTGGDLLDPLGLGNTRQLDMYDDLVGAGYKGPRTGLVPSGVGKNLSAFKQGFDKVADPRVAKQTKALTNLLGGNVQGPLTKGASKMGIQRLAGQALNSGIGKAALKYAPVVGTALSIGDLVLGDESLANKGMDAAMMAAGGAIGSVIPVVGTGLGVTGGKMLSDGIQFVFGGGKTPEQQRLEQALAQLNGGTI